MGCGSSSDFGFEHPGGRAEFFRGKAKPQPMIATGDASCCSAELSTGPRAVTRVNSEYRLGNLIFFKDFIF
jgi:hypothetical protein